MSPDISPTVAGDRLREARKARGISQADAAAEIGVSRPTFIAIEQGRRKPEASELVRLANLYGRSVHDIVRETPPVEALAASFRLSTKATGNSGALDAVGELERLADDVVEIEALVEAPMSRNYPAPYDIQGLPVEAAAEQVAQAERQRLGLGDGPVFNLRALLETEVGLKVFVFQMPRDISGMFAVAEPAGACIGINSQHPLERQRWSICHEYAHFLTTRWTAEVTRTDVASRQGGERFAELFAARFLMPAGSITRRFQSARRSRGGNFTPADLLQLASEYQVSAPALALRLEDLGLVGGGWWHSLESRGFKVNEARAQLGLAPGSPDDRLLPERIRYLAVEAYAEGRISEGRLARLFRLDRVSVRQVVAQMSASQDIGGDGDLALWIWGGGAAGDERE